MPRFGYLKGQKGEKAQPRSSEPAEEVSLKGQTHERVEPVYVRRETVRAVWRELKAEGGESVSELVEDLLLRWLSERRD